MMETVMDIQAMISSSGGIDAIASQLGIPASTAQAGLSALLPAVMGGFKKNAQEQPAGVGGLMDMIGGFGGGGLLENVVGPQPTAVSTGNDILGQIFGSPDTSRAVAAHAAGASGVDSSILKKMLPLVAMLVAGAMAKGSGGSAAAPAGGGIGGLLGGLLGGLTGRGAQPAAPAGGMGSLGGLGGLASMLDFDGDGNPLDDIMGMAGKLGAR
jgi:hypothetical protein